MREPYLEVTYRHGRPLAGYYYLPRPSDAKAARTRRVEPGWLCEAFGFEKHLVVPGEDGTIVHAQLVFGNGMVMLGSARASEFDDLQKPPGALGGTVSQSPYIIVDDVDKHYARAVAAGAEIVIGIRNEGYGGRDYSCRDPEGHVWLLRSLGLRPTLVRPRVVKGGSLLGAVSRLRG